MQAPNEPPLVSVVVPFHNTAAYLRECLESVLAQTHQRFELIVQDNASNDGSTAIAEEFAQRDPRVRLFRLDSLLPQVENYNLALSRIDPASAYCKIVQADDWIFPHCLEAMVEVARRSDRIGLVSSFRLEGTSVLGEGLEYGRAVVDGRELARLHLLSGAFLFGSPTTVMFRSDVVRAQQPFYKLGRLHEDTEACYDVLAHRDFGFVHQILSYSREDNASIYGQMRGRDTGILDKLIVLSTYGRTFLSEAELRARLEEVRRRYYRRLARAWLEGREPGYWGLHRRGLATIGCTIETSSVMRALARELLGLVACPIEMVQLVRSWMARLRRSAVAGRIH